MDLIKQVDSFLESPRPVDPPRFYRGFHPSGASCIIKNEYEEDETIGKCLRASYWAFKCVKPTNPMNARGCRITSVGRMVERWEVDRYKEMGIWRGNNIKFIDTDNNLSGETDAFIYDEKSKKIIGIEIKSGYGYKFQSEVIGKPGRKGKPKLDHLMQVMLYMNYFKNIPLFKIVYIDRGNAARAEFDITIDKKTGSALVDGKPYHEDITVPAILHRYKKLGECLDDGAVPPRDYQLQYTDEKIQLLYDSKRLPVTLSKQYERTQKITIGDWRCSYCDYKDHCWKGDR